MSGRARATRCEITAVIERSGPSWIGWIEEIPGVNCQERTREELLETLKITLREALDVNQRDAVCSRRPPSEKRRPPYEASGHRRQSWQPSP